MKRKMVFSALVASMVACCVQATVILHDEFNGTAGATVVGEAPDIVAASLSTNVWEGSTDMKYSGDGSLINAADNAYRAAAFNIAGAYTSNDIIRITAVVRNNTDKWAGIGFSTSNLGTGMNDNVGWINIQGDGHATPGLANLWAGPGASGSFTPLATGLWNTNATNVIEIRYNLSGNGSIRAYVNGTLAATRTGTDKVGMPDYLHLVFNNAGATSPPEAQFFESVTLEVQTS